MRQTDLVAEVEALVVEEVINRKQPRLKAWLKQAIIERHARIDGADVDFAVLCIAEHVEDTVEQVARRYKPKPDKDKPDPQMTFEGYDYIQKVYMVERDGDSVLVPTEQATPSELRAKAKELRQMGAGCYAHADELDRLADEREAEGA